MDAETADGKRQAVDAATEQAPPSPQRGGFEREELAMLCDVSRQLTERGSASWPRRGPRDESPPGAAPHASMRGMRHPPDV